MKIFIMISWRNLWRHKRRSIVIISSIAVGIFAMIFTIGFMNGFSVQMIDNTISSSIGHVSVQAEGYRDNMVLSKNFRPAADLAAGMNSAAVRGWAPRVKAQAMARSSEAARGVIITGIDPVREKTVSRVHEYIMDDGESRFLDSDNSDEILISKSMAEKLDLLVGDKMVIMLQDSSDEIQGYGLKVRGIFESPMESFDRAVVFTGIKKLQSMTGLGENISQITIISGDKANSVAVKNSLMKASSQPGLEILTWQEMAPNLVSSIKLFDSMMYVFFMIIFVTVIFSVANTLIMAVMERFHEIGVMKSIGTRPSMVFFMVMFEALNLGLIGLASGIISGAGLVYILSITGIDLSIFMESMRVWGSGSVIYPVIKLLDIVMAFVIVFITTVSAALYPAVKAARIKPLEALNFI
jgi:ABC-type lipoprotein release transport system permease subunit